MAVSAEDRYSLERPKQIGVLIPQEQLVRLKEISGKKGLSMSAYIRQLVYEDIRLHYPDFV